MAAEHPYYPRELSLPNYVPNADSLMKIHSIFFGTIAAVVLAAWLYSGWKPHLASSKWARVKLCWFVMCGLMHIFMEGYLVIFHKSFAGRQDILAQIWKEYSKTDSRYITGDAGALSIEGVTAFLVGPLCFLAALLLARNSPAHYVLELIISVCHVYGTILYFFGSWLDGFTFGPTHDPLHFWFYFIFLNSIWVVIPFLIMYETVPKLRVVQSVTRKGKQKKAN